MATLLRNPRLTTQVRTQLGDGQQTDQQHDADRNHPYAGRRGDLDLPAGRFQMAGRTSAMLLKQGTVEISLEPLCPNQPIKIYPSTRRFAMTMFRIRARARGQRGRESFSGNDQPHGTR
ncbi:MAG: hypothetical protein EA424_25860, partial [Planctomycetaceae bacterium]